MKKLVIIFAAVTTLLSASAFAVDSDNVTAKVKAAFEKDFSTANSISWEKNNELYLVTFKVDEMSINAAYNESGELVSATRNIHFTQLPLSVSMSLLKKFGGYNFPALVTEITSEGETHYYFAVENDKWVQNLKCSLTGEVMVDSKTKK